MMAKKKPTPEDLLEDEVFAFPKGSLIIPAENMEKFEKLLSTLTEEQRDTLKRHMFFVPHACTVMTEEEFKELDPDYKPPTKN